VRLPRHSSAPALPDHVPFAPSRRPRVRRNKRSELHTDTKCGLDAIWGGAARPRPSAWTASPKPRAAPSAGCAGRCSSRSRTRRTCPPPLQFHQTYARALPHEYREGVPRRSAHPSAVLKPGLQTENPDLQLEFAIVMVDRPKTLPVLGSSSGHFLTLQRALSKRDDLVRCADTLFKRLADFGRSVTLHVLANGLGTPCQQQELERSCILPSCPRSRMDIRTRRTARDRATKTAGPPARVRQGAHILQECRGRESLGRAVPAQDRVPPRHTSKRR
jgi:hypothetical protein